jgi:streptogramin lyase
VLRRAGWFLALAFLILSVSTCGFASVPDPVLGDVNGDGKVTIADAVLILRMAIGKLDPTPSAIAAGDLSPIPGTEKRPMGDGSLTASDAVQVLGKALGVRLLQQPPKVTVSIFAGSGVPGYADGALQRAKFQSPADIAVDITGVIYVADRNNYCIRRIDPITGDVTTLAGSGQAGQTDSPNGATAQFLEPKGIAVAPNGDIYVSDGVRIRRITPGGAVTTIAGSSFGDLDNAVGTQAQFKDPRGLAVDSLGNIYVADFGANKVKQISPSGSVTTVPNLWAILKNPSDVAVDQAGNIYVIDSGNSRLRRITPDGTVNTIAGSGEPGFADGLGIEAQFRRPMGMTIDAAGNIYIADTDNYRIRMVTPAGEVVTIAGQGVPGLAEGLGTNAKFTYPKGIAIGPAGDIYVTDEVRHRILRLSPPTP